VLGADGLELLQQVAEALPLERGLVRVRVRVRVRVER